MWKIDNLICEKPQNTSVLISWEGISAWKLPKTKAKLRMAMSEKLRHMSGRNKT